MCCSACWYGGRRAWHITVWPVRPICLGPSCILPTAQAVTCCLASCLDPSVSLAEKGYENWCDMPCPALELALHAQSVILYVAVPFGFPFCLASADRMYILKRGKALSVRHPLWCIPVFPMPASGCCACVVVRYSRSRRLASRLGSVRWMLGSLWLMPCHASQLRWCVRRFVTALAGACGGLAWWHARLLAWRGGSLGPLLSSPPQALL